MLIPNLWQEENCALPNIHLSNTESFHEPVDITGACCELKNCCDDNMDSLPNSPASIERAKCALRESLCFKQRITNEQLS